MQDANITVKNLRVFQLNKPTATVTAKSKLDIFEKLRLQNILVCRITIT